MMVRVPSVVPVTVGVKTTVTAHVPAAARDLVQVFAVMAKAAGLATMPSIVTAEVELFLMVTEWATLAVPTFRVAGKVIEVGDTVSGATAVPVTLTDCGSPIPV